PAPSPVPSEVVHDHSGGQRAFVTHHAIRRFCERVLGLGEEALEGVGDREAVEALRNLGMPTRSATGRGSLMEWPPTWGIGDLPGRRGREGAQGPGRDA
ncbi:hypothetical protein MZTS_18465, partial [Methylorubrum zatmanii]|nr:hypothetical protein [Methylorubrum zatmanii]